jgi:hypothetical protein
MATLQKVQIRLPGLTLLDTLRVWWPAADGSPLRTGAGMAVSLRRLGANT